jgi:Glycosyl transferase family 11
MQIVVNASGGLGSQLFQYAAGRCLARRYGASLRIAQPALREAQARARNGDVLLRQFALSAPVRRASYLDRLAVTEQPQLQRLARVVRDALNIQVLRQLPKRWHMPQQLRVRRGADTVYLQGSWQDYSLVREVDSDLRRELSPVEPLSGRNLALAQRIAAARIPVSLHLRRGHVARLSGAQVLPLAYYEHAISHMLDQNRQCRFFVFADDVAFASDWLRGDPRFLVVDHNAAGSAHEDLRLMSLCRHHIIADSAFSWWGAWLNPYCDKQVIAPARWLGYDTASSAIACPEWTLLDASLPRRLTPMAAA